MSTKAEDLMRQQYLVPRKSVKKLREMSRREGISAGELVRRAIDAYTSGKILPEPEEEVASRAVLKDIHAQVRAALARIDANLSEIRERGRARADGTFRAGWLPRRGRGSMHTPRRLKGSWSSSRRRRAYESHRRTDQVRQGHRTLGRAGGRAHGGEERNDRPTRGP